MVIGSEVHATRVSEKATVPLTNQSYNWSVDNRSKLVDVFYENLALKMGNGMRSGLNNSDSHMHIQVTLNSNFITRILIA
jgi:hypothetical protein